MPYCSACGILNEDEANFCFSCGNQIANTRVEAEATVPALTDPLLFQTPAPETSAIPGPPLMAVDQTDAGTFTAVGYNGQVELSGTRIKISHRGAMGFLTQGFKGEKEILVSQISSIQLKQPGRLSRGFIQFAFVGGLESKGGLYASVRDENSVLFDKKHQSVFEELKRRIDAVRDSVSDVEKGPAPANPPVWGLEELEKLASLHQRGIITDDEFATKKKEILGL